MVGILYSDIELNPHILRTGFPPKNMQAEKLDTNELHHTCIYPRVKHLDAIITHSDYDSEPYKLQLALGEPQLSFRSFDLSVLEFYRNDPRYLYKNDDINGFISIRDEYFESKQIAEHDQVLLESFGFSYDSEYNRAVAVYLCYIARLSPEHQQVWRAKELTGDYKLHPDYFRNTIMGEWGERVPIFSAFQKELYIINMMASAMERPPLFRHDFGEYGENKPLKFGFLIRPTLEEFNNFVLLLDKLLSDNINKDFFMREIPTEKEILRDDGKIKVQDKGTLLILDEWVRAKYRTADWEPWDQSIQTLREIRRLRQKPAHAMDENIFDQHYFKKQRQLIIKAYSALRTIRLLFSNHQSVKAANVEVPDWLQNGDIWTY